MLVEVIKDDILLKPEFITWVILPLSLWVLPWKGYALWKAARRQEKWWFIALLIVNTLAILEILYIFIFSKQPKQPNPPALPPVE